MGSAEAWAEEPPPPAEAAPAESPAGEAALDEIVVEAEAPAPEESVEGALAEEEAEEEEEIKTWGEQMVLRLTKGGWVVPIQLLISVVGLAFVLERLVRLRRSAVVPTGLAAQADRLWKEGQYDQVKALCRKHPSTLGRIIEFIVAHRGMSVADLSMTAGDIGSRDLKRHLQLAYPLSVVAAMNSSMFSFLT
jgi:biopolymer transport protein ExbB